MSTNFCRDEEGFSLKTSADPFFSVNIFLHGSLNARDIIEMNSSKICLEFRGKKSHEANQMNAANQ